jgi:hypothetical protein
MSRHPLWPWARMARLALYFPRSQGRLSRIHVRATEVLATRVRMRYCRCFHTFFSAICIAATVPC